MRAARSLMIGLFLITTCPALPANPAQVPHRRQVFKSIFFLDSQHGWIVAEEDNIQTLLQMKSGGDSGWAASLFSPDVRFSQIFFVDQSTGWAIGVDEQMPGAPASVLYQTTRGGIIWARKSLITSSSPLGPAVILDFSVVDRDHGWLIEETPGGKRVLLETRDGGMSFHQRNPPGERLGSRIYASANQLWIFGENGILASFDGGQSWISKLGPEDKVDGLTGIEADPGVMLNSGHGWATSRGGGLIALATQDDGKTWNNASEAQTEGGHVQDYAFWNERTGCAVTLTTQLYCSRDGGLTWQKNPLDPDHNRLGAPGATRVVFTSGDRIWVLSQDQILYRSDYQGESWDKISLKNTVKKKAR